MNYIKTRRFAFSGIVLLAACICSCATGQRGGSHSQESISLPFLFEDPTKPVMSWKIGHSSEDQFQRITEFVRPGQTVDNWTDLVTTQTFNKAAGLNSVEDQLTAYSTDLAARCPGSTVEVIRKTSDGVLYEARIVNCAQGADEHGLGRVLDGVSNRFIVQYAVRGAVTMTAERRAKWIENLMAVRII